MKTSIYKYLCVSIVLYIVCSWQTIGAQTPPTQAPKQSKTQVTDTISENGKKREKKTTMPIYQGIGVKLDLGNSLYEIFSSQQQGMSFEALAYVNLLKRYLPTLELGYAQRTYIPANEAKFSGKGAFTRIGCDFNLMKNKEMGNMFLIGARFGMAVQNYDISNLQIKDNYWNITQTLPNYNATRFDCWAEVVAGVEVSIYKGFNMGWAVRIKKLFTLPDEKNFHATYIPGYGYNDATIFTFNYYIGYNF